MRDQVEVVPEFRSEFTLAPAIPESASASCRLNKLLDSTSCNLRRASACSARAPHASAPGSHRHVEEVRLLLLETRVVLASALMLLGGLLRKSPLWHFLLLPTCQRLVSPLHLLLLSRHTLDELHIHRTLLLEQCHRHARVYDCA
jgi:hypothetical protein